MSETTKIENLELWFAMSGGGENENVTDKELSDYRLTTERLGSYVVQVIDAECHAVCYAPREFAEIIVVVLNEYFHEYDGKFCGIKKRVIEEG